MKRAAGTQEQTAMRIFLVSFMCAGLWLSSPASAADPDSDGDGLSDFQEVHKYFTDPKSADSDGDGIPDGDWHERREYSYSIRMVLKVLRPCDYFVAGDDYQDARLLSETDKLVELEVVHYPFNTNAGAIEACRDWRTPGPDLEPYLAAGVTTNWDDAMRRDLVKQLRADRIDIGEMTDREVVEQVAGWLLARGKYRYMFGTYFVHFPDGKGEIFPGLEDAFRREQGNTD